MMMDRQYGGVCYAGIDVDPELKYPKGKIPLFRGFISGIELQNWRNFDSWTNYPHVTNVLKSA